MQVVTPNSVPSTRKNIYKVDVFRGIDYSSSPTDINDQRSPDAMNMIVDRQGKVMKRTGYKLIDNYPDQVNGYWEYDGHKIVHAGTKIYCDGTEISAGHANKKSFACFVNHGLYIFSGAKPIRITHEGVTSPATNACVSNYTKFMDEVVIGGISTISCGNGTLSYTKTDGSFGFIMWSDSATTEQKVEDIFGIRVLSFTYPYVLTVATNIVRVDNLADVAYVPTTYVKKAPSGGGTQYEGVNLLNGKFTDSFIVSSGTATTFKLSFGSVTSVDRVEVLDVSGQWLTRAAGTDYTVNAGQGTVTFTSAIGVTPITGEDNVRITATRAFKDYTSRIASCYKGITYNSKGTSNRIFVTGCSSYPTYDWWCQVNTPEYFPDISYGSLGTADSHIVGYSVVASYLATFISPSYDGRCVYLRDMSLDEDNNPIFPIAKVLQGEEAIAENSFQYMDTEPLFLTNEGVYAITSADVDGNLYTQNRSFFINKEIKYAEGLANAVCCKFKQFYIISYHGKFYFLDTSQKAYNPTEPKSHFQYECYVWDNVNAVGVWSVKDNLYFADGSGNFFEFIKDTESPQSYADHDSFSVNGSYATIDTVKFIDAVDNVAGVYELEPKTTLTSDNPNFSAAVGNIGAFRAYMHAGMEYVIARKNGAQYDFEVHFTNHNYTTSHYDSYSQLCSYANNIWGIALSGNEEDLPCTITISMETGANGTKLIEKTSGDEFWSDDIGWTMETYGWAAIEFKRKAINAYWTIPDFSGKVFWRNKTIKTIAFTCAPFLQSKIYLLKRIQGQWSNAKEWSGSLSWFQWNGIDWASWSWSNDYTYRTITSKIKIKKFDKASFKLTCPDIYKAFGLYEFSAEYTENGRYKK